MSCSRCDAYAFCVINIPYLCMSPLQGIDSLIDYVELPSHRSNFPRHPYTIFVVYMYNYVNVCNAIQTLY